jgi:hypothetical protein
MSVLAGSTVFAKLAEHDERQRISAGCDRA